MNILLDTNILIPLEDTGRELDPRLAEMRRSVEQQGHHLFTHPAQLEDINRDRDNERRCIVLSRIQQYHSIPNPPNLSEEERGAYEWSEGTPNDRIDNLLLYAVVRGVVHILVSNDERVHRKAVRANVHSQVYRLTQFIDFLNVRQSPPFRVPYGIRERHLYEFNVNQSFFDSLRLGYDDFNVWYLNSSSGHRKCWCIASDDASDLQAICIFKHEDSPVVTSCGARLDGRVLKLCTLKVGEAIRGKKVGERLLFTAFKYASENNIDHIYIHADACHHEHLISLVLDYGFQRVGLYGTDEVYSKPMHPLTGGPATDLLNYAIRYYPNFVDDDSAKKFIIPIRPEYHEDLFPDISDFSNTFFANDPNLFSPQSNTIKKAYLCHSKVSGMTQGDVILFFRTRDRRSIQVVGVVERVLRTQDFDVALSVVSKRTVFDNGRLRLLLDSSTLIILFRLMKYIPAISHARFAEVGIAEPIQTIRMISQQSYTRLISGPVA